METTCFCKLFPDQHLKWNNHDTVMYASRGRLEKVLGTPPPFAPMYCTPERIMSSRHLSTESIKVSHGLGLRVLQIGVAVLITTSDVLQFAFVRQSHVRFLHRQQTRLSLRVFLYGQCPQDVTNPRSSPLSLPPRAYATIEDDLRWVYVRALPLVVLVIPRSSLLLATQCWSPAVPSPSFCP